jgi:hypothetical protein
MVKGGESMNRLQQVAVTVPDEQTLRDLEDMRTETLHELEDGAVVPDESIETLGEMMVVLESWPPAVGAGMGRALRAVEAGS